MNKTTFTLLTAATLTMFAVSCKKKTADAPDNSIRSAVNFTSSFSLQTSTKASGNTWDANDNIGVFSKKNSDGTIVDANKKHTTNGNGNFTATGADVINYPTDGSSLNFVAYYPYSSALAGTTFPVNVASQSNPASIDLMYSNNATNYNQAGTTTPNLIFIHQLSKVEITVKAGPGVTSLSGLTTTFQNFNTTANFDLNTGALTTGTAPADINAKITTSATDQLAAAIMLPLADASSKTVLFTLPSGDNFTWTFPAGTKFETGKKNTYTIVLQKSGSGTPVAVALGAATITNWTDVPGGTITLNPNVTTPTPTEQQVFLETFGTKDLSTAPSKRLGITVYDNYDNTFTFTGNASIADPVITNGFTTNNIRFLSTESNIVMAGINTDGYTNIKVQLQAILITQGTYDFTNLLTIKYNGVEYTVPATPATSITAVTNLEISLNAAAASATSTLEIIGNKGKVTATPGPFLRVDNVKMLGTK